MQKIDVWALGCMVGLIDKMECSTGIFKVFSSQTFKLLTGNWLFEPEGCEE
jgi:hypothetical protein